MLLLDAEAAVLSVEAVDVACRLVPPGGVLHVLAAVRLPLAVALDAPPGEETARMAALLAQVERLAGRRGVAVRAHLRRGRHVRAMLRTAVLQYGPDVVVCFGTLARLADLAVETGAATPVLVPLRGEGG
jgi:nucleotide-binding universal stress UspA family protein